MSNMEKHNNHENEKWWQEHGEQWEKEIIKRRSSQPLYTVQEVVISSYLSNLPKGSKVLEFGVGFGRHFEYINELGNIEMYGVDQSPTMLEVLKNNIKDKNMNVDDRLVLIQPRQKLPFDDNYFDVVYTVSVLIHINPEDINEILKELIRVSKKVIFHFENTYVEKSFLSEEDHGGCWKHSIVELYKNLGYECSIQQKVALEQDFYFINKMNDMSYNFNINPVILKRLSMIDSYVAPYIKTMEGEVGWRAIELEKREKENAILQGEVGWRAVELEKREKEIQNLKNNVNDKNNKIAELEGEVGWRAIELQKKENMLFSCEAKLEASETMLEEIKSSLGWKMLQKIRSMNKIYFLSNDLRKFVKNKSTENQIENTKIANLTEEKGNQVLISKSKISDDVKRCIDSINEKSIIAIHHPNWLGVTNSTRELFENLLPLKEVLGKQEAEEIADYICNKKPIQIVFSGFAEGWVNIARSIKKINPSIKITVFWHGNTTHMYEDYSWSRYQEILSLWYEGILDKWGFAKESMTKLYQNIGISSYFISNYVSKDNGVLKYNKEQTKENNKISIGIYASGSTWNKNAYTQIAAASLIENACVRSIPVNDRMKLFGQQLGIEVIGNVASVSRKQLYEDMRKNDINFYVTFSECAPLFPLESLNMGVLCITGPNHHYFKGTPLEEYLVVNFPDDPIEIANKAKKALAEKDKIINLYEQWYQENELKSKNSIENFIKRID